jgi:hypothetical protein
MYKAIKFLLLLILLISAFYYFNKYYDNEKNANLIKHFKSTTKLDIPSNYRLDLKNNDKCGLDVCFELVISFESHSDFEYFVKINKVENWEKHQSNSFKLYYFNGKIEYTVIVDKFKENIYYEYGEI